MKLTVGTFENGLTITKRIKSMFSTRSAFLKCYHQNIWHASQTDFVCGRSFCSMRQNTTRWRWKTNEKCGGNVWIKKKQQTWLVCNRNAVRVVAVFWCLFLLFLAGYFLSDNKHQLGACFLASHSISQLNFSERRVRRFQLTKCGTKMQQPPTIGG